MSNRNYVNPDVMKVANMVLEENKEEFTCIRIGKDPRTIKKPTWISIDEAMDIYHKLEQTIGINLANINSTDIEYAIHRPLVNIVDAPEKSRFSKICECVWMLNRYNHNRSIIQFSATIFLTLCKLNDFKVSFKTGEIYEIFNEIYDNPMTADEVERIMLKHLVSEIPQSITSV